MRRRFSLLFAFACLAVPPAVHAADPKADHFEARVRPVLLESCVRCHGSEKQSGGLRLDSRAAVLKGGGTGAAIDAGKPAESLLLKAVRREKGVEAMPPKAPLKPEAVAALEQWIRDGAEWPASAGTIRPARHWAFEPVRAIEPPAGTGNPIDRFVLAKLSEKGLAPVGHADKLTLIRRATFDLTGLPPTPDQIDAYVKDTSPDAFAKLIDRLLASPAYGEKWGRHWLDVVRYADTAGETADFPVPDAWRYRNYVIAAFNSDKPFDRFIAEQLAGDIEAAKLPPDAPRERFTELVTATGYLAISRRYGYDPKADHFLTLEDTIDTFGKSFLGLTIACARCHDHKYDPISADDYYALYGIFESTRYPYSGAEKDKVPKDCVTLASRDEIAKLSGALRGLTGNAAAMKAEATAAKGLPRAYAVWEGQPHDAQLQKRGDPNTRGDPVPRHFLTVLGGQKLPPNSGSGRVELAQWVTDPMNPLTARVFVNRVWAGHFGTGLVATPNDFGTRGSPPTHPELLDWLAAKFVAGGWKVKDLHRLIMLSETYQRSSSAEPVTRNPERKTVLGFLVPGSALPDPGFSRFPRRRLEAEEIRDAMLAVSGDLDTTPGGPHPFPDSKAWGYTQHNPFAAVYETNRRSVYLMTQRIKRHPFLALFDGPDPNTSTPTRLTTTVPTQALFFLNDPFAHARADSLAVKLLKLPDDKARVETACRLFYGRPALAKDHEIAGRFLVPIGDRKAACAAWLRVLFASNEFVYVD